VQPPTATARRPGGCSGRSCCLIPPIIGLFFFLQRCFVEGVTLTGIKN
jgi:hypothetical protein